MADNSNPFDGLPDGLKPTPPAAMPEPQAASDGMAYASPFKEAQSVESIIDGLQLDSPLKLFIPRAIMERFPQTEFRLINSIPSEIAAAHNKGFREVTDPEAVAMYGSLVAGTDKTGKAFFPLLYGRPKEVGDFVRNRVRKQLSSLYAGMDPSNKDLSGKYTANVDAKDGTKGQFTGQAFRVKTG